MKREGRRKNEQGRWRRGTIRKKSDKENTIKIKLIAWILSVDRSLSTNYITYARSYRMYLVCRMLP